MDAETHDRFEAVETEIQRLRDWKHDKVAQMLQRHESDIGSMQKAVGEMATAIKEAAQKTDARRESQWVRWEDRIIGAILAVAGALIVYYITKGK